MYKIGTCLLCVILMVVFVLVEEPLKIAFAIPASVSLFYVVIGAIEESILEEEEKLI